jgi:YegS/Rv2252/BmrU family lipid kinase
MTLRRAALIFNPAAGRANDGIASLRVELDRHFELTVFETCPEQDADVCATRALESKPDLVIASGGDGTVSMVARALVDSTVALGIVARGTANSLAGALGIPIPREEALRALIEGQERLVDTALANGRVMLLHASAGFHAAAVANTPREAKNRWGILAYVKEGLASLAHLEPFQVELETEREVVRCSATNIMVANVAPPRTVLAQGPRALSPDDGALDVTITAATGIAEAVVTGLHLLRTAIQGEPATRDNVGFLSAHRVRIETVPAQPLLIDGEEAGHGTLRVECRPRSLKLVVPASADLSPAKPDEEKLEGLPDLEVEPKRRAR